MNTKDFKNMHKDAVEKTGLNAKINQQIGKMYQNKDDRAKYLEWVTAEAKDEKRGDGHQKNFSKEVKAIQNNLNLTNTQKLMLRGEVTKEALTQKVRLMRANKPLMHKGKVTQKQVDAKEYLFIVEDIVKVEHTFAKDLKALMTRYNATNVEVKKALKIK